jgi:hypothetical protein
MAVGKELRRREKKEKEEKEGVCERARVSPCPCLCKRGLKCDFAREDEEEGEGDDVGGVREPNYSQGQFRSGSSNEEALLLCTYSWLHSYVLAFYSPKRQGDAL